MSAAIDCKDPLAAVFGSRVMFVGAHPDDVELNAGGLMARLRHAGAYTMEVLLSASAPRWYEVVHAQRALGFESLHSMINLGGKDTQLIDSRHHLIKRLEECVHQFEPTSVVTHFYGDTHQDHSQAYVITVAACRSVRNLLMYKPTFPSGRSDVPFHPTLYVDFTEHAPRKVKALEAFESQMPKYGGHQWVESVLAGNCGDSWQYNGRHGWCELFQASRVSL